MHVEESKGDELESEEKITQATIGSLRSGECRQIEADDNEGSVLSGNEKTKINMIVYSSR